MGKTREIHCPKCKQVIAHYDGKSTINVVVTCQKCRKRVVYHVDTEEIDIKSVPPRHCSSGKCFS